MPEFSSWGWDDSMQYRRVDRYLSETKGDIHMHPSVDPKIKIISFYRPPQYYFKAFKKADL
jgi:hypothetical protein